MLRPYFVVTNDMGEPLTPEERAALWRLIVYIAAVPLALALVTFLTALIPLNWLATALPTPIAEVLVEAWWSYDDKGAAVSLLVMGFAACYVATLLTAYAVSLAIRLRDRARPRSSDLEA
ncbi:MAG: hypothetical protein ACE5FA_14035 [Dehalococcoidia bacterium]